MDNENTSLLHGRTNTDSKSTDIVGKSSLWRQFTALFIKQAILQVRHKWQNIFIIGVPIIMIAFTGILQLIVNKITPVVQPTRVEGVPIPLNFFDTPPLNLPTSDPHFYQSYYYTTNQNSNFLEIIGFRNLSGNSSGMLSQISTVEFRPEVNHTEPHLRVPFFDYFNTTQDVEHEVVRSLNFLASSASADAFKKNMTMLYKLPDGIIYFRNVSNESLAYDITTNENEYFQRASFGGVAVTNSIIRARAISNINAAYVRQFTPKKVRIVTLVQTLPYIYQSENFDVMLVVGIALFPSAISFLMPVFLQSLVMEKEKKLREMMKMMGMSSMIYWLVNYIFNYALYTCVCVVFIGVELAFQVRFFTQTHPLLLFLLFFLWGHAMIAIAFLASTIFSRSSQATLFGYLVAILSMVSAEILVTSVYDQNSKAPWWFWTYPYYCFYRGIFLMFMPCLDQKQCIQWFDTDTWYGGELGKSYLCMTLQTVIMLILAWYFNHVIPQEFGIRKHPLFMFAPLKKLFKTKRVDDDTIETSKEKSVLAHEQDVYNGVYINEPLVIKKLHKRYASKVALRSLTLGVRRDECFGLLGPNGAGKTTMLSILFGLFPPSSGSAYVAGYPLDKITSIQRHIGVSMQFDVLWDSLTVTEHLTFYSRLKGVRGIKPHVEMLIANVGLEEKKNTQASALSGGMRRRLSLAIAMIGDPQVVFLDEPTTGLDPQSRRSVWDCIEKFQRGRAMILCTHSMDEASVLCHRLGLLNNGELQFVGTQFELREKLAEYKYRLDISFDEENRDHVIEYVYGLVDQGDISSIQDDKTEKEGRASFGLTENVKLSSVWRKMESDSKQIGKINEWALGQMHLETMFVKLIKEQQMEPNADANV